MDRYLLKTQIVWMNNIRSRLDWYYAAATAIFRDSGLPPEEAEKIKQYMYEAEDSIDKAADILRKATGEDEEE